MSFSIQTNMNSLNAQRNMEVNNAFQSKTIQQLTSGYRINQSGDDAAGLAVANKFRNNIAELTQGVSNANDGVSQLQIMDGGVNNIATILDRLKTLAAQSASSTFTGDRAQLNAEFQTDVQEIDRQAQSIGLNTGGSFAKNLAVYIGVGSGSASLNNGAVNVDLSKSTVDVQSLGLSGVQARNSNVYDLSAASATSVQNIVTNGVNAAVVAAAGSMQFTFHGAGFANDTSTPPADAGITIKVDVSGVADTNTLITQINSAIQTAGNGATGPAAAFKAAGITASIVTDSNGNQKLAFSSSDSAFQVKANDVMASALLGNFANGSTGSLMGTTQTGRASVAAIGSLDFSNKNVTLTFTGAGLSNPVQIKLVANDSATTTTLATDINAQLTAAGITNQIVATTAAAGSALLFTAAAGTTIGLTVSGAAAGITALGLDNSAATAGSAAGGAQTMYSTYNANGASQLGSSGSSTSLLWGGLADSAGDSQSITISANDAAGAAHQQTVQLTKTAATLDTLVKAVAGINDGLQKSNDATLQQITAVVVNDNGVAKVNFVSNLQSFGVSVGDATGNTGNTASTTEGLYQLNSSNAIVQGFNAKSTQVGSGGTADISTSAGALTALTAISEAVNTLGSAQAAIGKGQNVFNYAISLAQSQITNFSSAQSQIRDADVAMEAANLTKAQVLQQASIAAMAQANSAPQALLKLLG